MSRAYDILHICPHSAVQIKIAVYILSCLCTRSLYILCKRKVGDSVNYAEIDRLCHASHFRRNKIRRDVKHAGGGHSMNILLTGKGVQHFFIICHVGQNPKLNLRIVGVHQHAVIVRCKHSSQLTSQFCTNRDILQIRLCWRYTPRLGHRLIKACVYFTVLTDKL